MADPLWRVRWNRIRDDFDRERHTGQPLGAVLTHTPAIGGVKLADAGTAPCRPPGETVKFWTLGLQSAARWMNRETGECVGTDPGYKELGELVIDGDRAAGGQRRDRFVGTAAAAAHVLADLPPHSRDRLPACVRLVSNDAARWLRLLFDLAMRRPSLIPTPATPAVWWGNWQADLECVPHIRRHFAEMAPLAPLPEDDRLLHWYATIPDVFVASMYACDVLIDWAETPPPEANANQESATPTGDQAEQAEGASKDDGEPVVATVKRKRTRRGRPRHYDPKLDKRLSDAWSSGQYQSYKDMRRPFGMNVKDIANAIKRHRMRQSRKGD